MRKIKTCLISVFNKDGLSDIIAELKNNDIRILSTGGTYTYLMDNGLEVDKVEDLTSYPSILDGRVKTLHPKVFGGILARRADDHLAQLEQYEIPEIDCVVVDLYPFEDTVKATNDEAAIIEKIDIGGIALIRAAAKNYGDVVIIPSKEQYPDLVKILKNDATSSLEERKGLAREAFKVSSHYDTAIFDYFDENKKENNFKHSILGGKVLRYGENPHQQGIYFGEMESLFHKLSGKELSYNNLVDIDAAVALMSEFHEGDPCFAVLKHTNPCGIAIRPTILEAWHAALAGDPVSAFGGILIANKEIDLVTAEEINKLFYEVLIAPSFSADAEALLTQKKKRVLMKINHFNINKKIFKSILNGVIQQDADHKTTQSTELEIVTKKAPSVEDIDDLLFAEKCAKHLKSNTIVLASGHQLLGMGSGQTSRVDACNQAIDKAKRMGFSLEGAVMASDAFFPFPDCVELAHKAGITSIIQPGGSIKDKLSIEYCDNNDLAMVFTGTRHFKH
jgi:phosphoribosylaminoimidazolecarboxamide formyltransferase/IMP cyclohydrolase